MSDQATCGLCGQPMPAGEEMFKYHGYSGPCPAPPLIQPEEFKLHYNGVCLNCGFDGMKGSAEYHAHSCIEQLRLLLKEEKKEVAACNVHLDAVYNSLGVSKIVSRPIWLFIEDLKAELLEARNKIKQLEARLEDHR